MKRLALLAIVLASGLVAARAEAGPYHDFQRWWGINYGKGIHAKDGCGGVHPYYMYDGGDVIEEIAPGKAVPPVKGTSLKPTTSKYNMGR